MSLGIEAEMFLRRLEDLNYSDDAITRYNNWLSNRAVDLSTLVPIAVAYILLIIIGTTGNTLVIIAVVRQSHMKTARNILIMNLAISDIILCIFTMPFSLLEVLSKHWTLGPTMCKLSGALQASSIFVSTISITAIAIDRYKLIIYPTKSSMKVMGANLVVLLIWIISLMMSSPLIVFKKIKKYEVDLPGLETIEFCWEVWPIEHGRAMYSVMVMIFQYLFPIITLVIIHFRICKRLKNRFSLRMNYRRAACDRQEYETTERSRARERKNRTNHLLLAIACIFAVTWLPLNILNLISDFGIGFEERTTFNIVFAICHMVGMSSACSNPILYGWLNENFRKEFCEMFNSVMCKKCSASKITKDDHICENGATRKNTATQLSVLHPSGNVIRFAEKSHPTEFHQSESV
ncbi:NPY1R (predicted) [Pycnogonum litorale]